MPDDVEPVSSGSRDDMAAAYDAVMASETPAETPQAPAESTPSKEAPPAPAPSETPQEGPQRDDKGRFVPGQKKPGAPPEPKPATPPGVTPGNIGQPVAPPPSSEPAVKPPQSLKPAEREEFAKAPRAIQEALVRRERETQTALNESARAREFEGQFRNTVGPYEAMLRSEGVQPMQAVDALLRLSYALRTGTPEQKAQILAHHVRQFLGTDEQAIGLLAKAIDGSLQAVQQQPPQFRDPRVDELLQRFQAAEQRQMESVEQQGQREAEEIKADPDCDLIHSRDVADAVADELLAAANLKKELTIRQAYEKVVWGNPEWRRIMQQREAAKAAANGNASTQRAKLAASSVKSQPGGTVVASPGDDWRSHLEAAWDKAAS